MRGSAGSTRRGAGGGGGGSLCGGRTCTTLVLAAALAVPLAMVIAMPLSVVLARRGAGGGDGSDGGARGLRAAAAAAAGAGDGADAPRVMRTLELIGVETPEDDLPQAARPSPAANWAVSSTLAHSLVGEDFRLETVLVDVGATRHYISLCDRTLPADFLLGGKEEYEAEPVMQWRAPGKEDANPITCASGRIFMVDMRDLMIADELLTYIFREEPWSIELWVGILTADRCRHMKSALPGPHACAANWGPLLGGKRPLVLDIGANHGFYGLLAARLGYNVVAVDPQPQCAQYVRVAGAASEYPPDRFRVVNAFLAKGGVLPSPRPDVRNPFKDALTEGGSGSAEGITGVPVSVRTGCWGTYPVPDSQDARVRLHFGRFPGGNATVEVPVVDPRDLLGEEEDEVVVLAKIDTEGAELDILRALLPALDTGRILNLLVEINKGVDGIEGQPTWPEWRKQDIIDTLTLVASKGYTVLCAQSGKTAGWSYSPRFKTREEITEFVADGWRAANVWIAKDFWHEGADWKPLPEVAPAAA